MAKSKSKMLVVSAVPQVSAGSKKRKKKAKKRVGKAISAVTALTPYLKLLVDPWNADLDGAQCPDANRMPTLPWKERTGLTLTTDAQGNLLMSIRTILNGGIATYTLNPSGVATALNSQSHTNYAALSTTFFNYRTYAVAVHMTYIGQADTQKGLFYTATSSAEMGSTTGSQALLMDEPDYKEVSSEEDVCSIIRLHGPEFVRINATVPTTDASVYTYVGCTGLPASTACVRLEIVWAGEVTIDPTQLMSRSVSYSPTHPAQVHAGANIIGPSTTTAVGKDPKSKLIKQAEKAVAIGAKLNGLYQGAQQLSTIAAEFGALFV